MKITRKKPLAKEWFTGLGLAWQRAPVWGARPVLAFFQGHRPMNKLTAAIGAFALLTFTHGPNWAGDLTIPHDFVSGTPAIAGEVNANFDAVETAVDDNDARITTNKADIATNKGDITDLKTGLGANAVTVNCGTDTIGAALAAATPGGALVITVNGTCPENVTIARDDVTLLSGGTGAIVGEVLIDAARRAVIDGLTVSGAGNGILAQRNATVTVQNSTIENNTFSGIDVKQGAFAFIDNNTIRGNVDCGVIVRDGGTVRLRNNTVESAQGDVSICSTIGAFRHASARLVGGNTVTNTAGGFALDLAHGSTFSQKLGHDTIVGKVSVFNMCNADFRDVDITGDIFVDLNSVLRLRDEGRVPGNVTVTGTIQISSHIAQFSGSSPVTVSGDVNCFVRDGLAFGSPIFASGMLNCP